MFAMKRKDKLKQINREARWVLYATIAIILFWVIAGFGVSALDITIFHTPLWAITGCIGTWVFAIALVCWLMKHIFRDFSLDDGDEEDGDE